MTLYTQAASNRLRTAFFLVVYVLLITGLGGVISYATGQNGILLFAALLAVGQAVAGIYASDRIALASAGAVPLDPIEYPEAARSIASLAITTGLPEPRLFVIDSPSLNAFASGRDPAHAVIAVTSGALEGLDRRELEGVLAHEMAHVGNWDIRLMGLVTAMAGVIALISQFFLRSLWFGGGRRDDRDRDGGSPVFFFLAIAAAVLAPLASAMVQLAISRKREFLADATGVLTTRDPEGLIRALEKIGAAAEPVEQAGPATAHLYFSNPLAGGFLRGLFSTHPPLEQRIAALRAGTGLPTE